MSRRVRGPSSETVGALQRSVCAQAHDEHDDASFVALWSCTDFVRWRTDGSVHWNYQKEAAAATVRHVIGATGVTVGVTVVDTVPVPATGSRFGPFVGQR
jgi:hypothetical protein